MFPLGDTGKDHSGFLLSSAADGMILFLGSSEHINQLFSHYSGKGLAVSFSPFLVCAFSAHLPWYLYSFVPLLVCEGLK